MIVRGIQIDVTVRQYSAGGIIFEAPSCDYDCWNSDYKCPAANLNSRTSGNYAPLELIIQAINNTDRGLRRLHSRQGKTEINLFGGNAALHPNILDMIKILRGDRYSVCLSTPGRKIVINPDFREALIDAHPQVVAFSADSISATTISSLTESNLAIANLYSEATSQEQKAIAGICAASQLQGIKNAPKILFNVVLHPGNIDMMYSIINALGHSFPDCLINPYPAQSSFYNGATIFGAEHISALNKFIDRMLISTPPNVLKRDFYWRTLSGLRYLEDKEFCAAISGKGVWKCTHGNNPYVQIGRYNPKTPLNKVPGGYLNCFWNPNGCSNIQLWNASDEEVDIALSRFGSQTCQGCIMPRLLFNNENTKHGLLKRQ